MSDAESDGAVAGWRSYPSCTNEITYWRLLIMAQDTSLMELQRNAFDTPKRFAIVRYSDVEAR